MNWVVVTTLTIQLSNPVHIGIAANAATSRAEAEFQMLTIASEDSPNTPRQITFTIDTAEIQGAAEILSDIGSVVVGTQKTTLPVADGIMHYMVLSEQGDPIGYDVYIPGLKESVVFNASNTVKAAAYEDARLIRWPISDKLELYKLFESDPNFASIVQQVRDAGGLLPNHIGVWKQIRQLAQDVATKYATSKGWISDIDTELHEYSLSPRAIRQDFNGEI